MALRFALALVLALAAFPHDASAQRRDRDREYYGGYSGITVYADPGFRGRSVSFRNEVSDLRQHGFNDRVSSLDIEGNQAWEVCRDINFGGGCRVFTRSVDDLRAVGWNDRISSMRAVGYGRESRGGGWWGGDRYGRRENEGLVLYAQPNFRGDRRDVSSGSSLGGFSGRVRSVEVYGGTWQLCDSQSRNARCVTVSRSVPDVRRLGLRDIAFVREIGNQGRRY